MCRSRDVLFALALTCEELFAQRCRKTLSFTFAQLVHRIPTAKTADATGGRYVKPSKRTQMLCFGSAKVHSRLFFVSAS
jgi:hypothetical protein